MVSFASALDRSMETIKRPPPAPLGDYQVRVLKMPDTPESFTGKDGTEFDRLTFNCALVAALDSVDPDELEAFGKVEGTPVRHTFIFNKSDEQKFEATLNRLKNFLKALGIDIDTGSLGEKLAETPNCQFGATIEHRLDPQDSQIIYAELVKTYAL